MVEENSAYVIWKRIFHLAAVARTNFPERITNVLTWDVSIKGFGNSKQNEFCKSLNPKDTAWTRHVKNTTKSETWSTRLTVLRVAS